ncbi:hypothetical protein HY68_16165 [Streptomyces sp. AcH 505]|uniref:hypothetical protein n=1 Tax=Streptomyces sp. AcH 505 TaxID=352211 RepID=UPI0005924143|nr:hypothetical protein HY68_16165 [Streptomyces sp. AcH 505]
MDNENEAEVKRALGISSWRNLSKDKVIKFAAMMPDMSTEVRLKIIEQFPAFKDLAKNSVDSVKKAYESTLSANEKSQENFHQASQQHREALKEDLGRDDLSWEQRQFLHDRFQQNVGQEAQKDSENKQFLERGFRTVAVTASAAIAVGAVFVGARIMGESKENPEDSLGS